jgi:hypothetical protein
MGREHEAKGLPKPPVTQIQEKLAAAGVEPHFYDERLAPIILHLLDRIERLEAANQGDPSDV